MKLDFNKFKKVSEDQHTATMRHEDGHELRIAKSALTPKLREQMTALPMASGGNPKLQESDKTPSETRHMDEGGAPENAPLDPRLKSPMAVEDQDSGNTISKTLKDMGVGQFASDEYKDTPQAVSTPQFASAATPSGAEQPAAPTGDVPAPSQSPFPAGPAEEPMTVQSALKQEMQAQDEMSQAKAMEGQARSKAITAAQGALQKNQDVVDTAIKNHADELAKFTQDVKDGYVNPEKYWENHSKLTTGLGILLAGINPTGSPNAAVEFLNHNMNRSMEAQARNLGAKENLLHANMQAHRDNLAVLNQTRLHYMAMGSLALDKAAADAATPMAAAQAKQAKAQLLMQAQPLIRQVAMSDLLRQQTGGGGVSQLDPSIFVNDRVPPAHQAKVFAEIGAAQNTARMGDEIMKAFDQAAQENTVMKTGAGLLRTPASVLALHQHMQPTFQDLEGTVRQAAMDNTFKNITPRPGDTEHTVATKRDALEKYLQSKASAPTAKGYGMDLNQFQSTSWNRANRLAPEQQAIYQWAKANPSNPNAQKIFQKLGVK